MPWLALAARTTRKTVENLRHKAQWLVQYDKLVQYRRENGDCNVPKRWKKDISLATWVSNQRKIYRQTKDGKSLMYPERIDKLNRLGFVWSLRKIRSATATSWS